MCVDPSEDAHSRRFAALLPSSSIACLCAWPFDIERQRPGVHSHRLVYRSTAPGRQQAERHGLLGAEGDPMGASSDGGPSVAEQVTRLIEALATYTTCQHGLPHCACTEKARNTLWNLHPASDGKGGIDEELLIRNRREAINARRRATKADKKVHQSKAGSE